MTLFVLSFPFRKLTLPASTFILSLPHFYPHIRGFLGLTLDNDGEYKVTEPATRSYGIKGAVFDYLAIILNLVTTNQRI